GGHGARHRIDEYCPSGAVEQDDADRQPVEGLEFAVLQGRVAIKAEAQQKGAPQVWVEPREKLQRIGLEGSLTRAATDIEAGLKAALCGERNHRAVGDGLGT